MFVKLIDHMGDDVSVVNAARVSFNKSIPREYDDKGLLLKNKDIKLINYLAAHNHWTPFAHTSITMHIKAPIPIRTQFFKHKVGFVENEISRRYVDEVPTEVFQPEWANRPERSIKQGSGELMSVDERNNAHLIYNFAVEQAIKSYESLIHMGVAPEQARFVLPQGTYTEWYWTGSLAAYARFVNQRTHTTAQKEIQVYADKIAMICHRLFPYSMAALTGNPFLTE